MPRGRKRKDPVAGEELEKDDDTVLEYNESVRKRVEQEEKERLQEEEEQNKLFEKLHACFNSVLQAEKEQGIEQEEKGEEEVQIARYLDEQNLKSMAPNMENPKAGRYKATPRRADVRDPRILDVQMLFYVNFVLNLNDPIEPAFVPNPVNARKDFFP